MSGIQPARNSKLWPLIAEAESLETGPDRLRQLSVHSSAWVRRPVSLNPNTPDAVIVDMIKDDGNSDLSWIDALPGRPELEAPLSRSSDQTVREALAFAYVRAPGQLARSTQQALSRDPAEQVRVNLAQAVTYRDLFEALLVDESPRVRASCGGNPRIERDQMGRLIADSHRIVRHGAIASGMRYPDAEQLLHLASDKSAGVRWDVLFAVYSPREAIELISHDTDEDNRRHARSRLKQDDALYSEQVIASTIEASTRATPGEWDAVHPR